MIFWFYRQQDDLLAINYQLAFTVANITGYEVLGSDMPPSTSGYKDWAIEKLAFQPTVEQVMQRHLCISQYDKIWNYIGCCHWN